MTSPTDQEPVLSVIIPARKCREDLTRCLESLERSDCRNFEVIVVDDASPDDTTSWIKPEQARVLVLPNQSGPAVARNLGAQIARGEYLLFLDADVCAHPGTVGRVIQTLAGDPTVAAVFGSYDTEPHALNVLSQYRNLMHHFVHQEGRTEATTFWTGCGAIRRSVFLEAGGFDPDYRRPCIEDIELGVRLHKAGHRILLNKDIQVAHRKRWTFWGMLKADIRDRAWPWSRLILSQGSLPNDLNLGMAHRISALLACGLLGTLLVAAWHLQVLLAVPIVVLLGIALVDAWSLTRRVPTTFRLACVLAVLCGTALLATYFETLVLIPLGLLAGMILLNWRFYAFLARARHPLFAALAVPLQVLHYLYSVGVFGIAFLLRLTGAGAPEKPPLPKLTCELASKSPAAY